MILVTGTSGFIGKHLLSHLVEEYGSQNIVALTSVPTSACHYLLHNNYQFEDDYFLRSGYENIETIIHVGAFTPKTSAFANDGPNCTSNITNTQKLLSSTLPLLKKFIFISTLDVYGQQEIISEDTLTEPVSLYGHSKLYCEKLLTAWAEANDKIYQILRVGHVYGPGEELYQKIIPVTMKKLIQDQPLQIWGTGKEIRSFIYIKDIVYAIIQSIELNENVGVINLVSGHKISIKELVAQLVTISDKCPVIERVQEHHKGRDLIFDNAKMKQYLLASETSLHKGLLEEWNYMIQLFS